MTAVTPVIDALRALGHTTNAINVMTAADALDALTVEGAVERLEAALSAVEKVSGLSSSGLAKRRLERVFEGLGVVKGAIQASIEEGRVSAQWTPPDDRQPRQGR